MKQQWVCVFKGGYVSIITLVSVGSVLREEVFYPDMFEGIKPVEIIERCVKGLSRRGVRRNVYRMQRSTELSIA